MNSDFFVAEERLATLMATPAGRSSEGGYNYQRSYAVARLASMRTFQVLLGLGDYPKRLRYDWADDLDELLGDGSVCFTQCKRVGDTGRPAKLAQVLVGFAPKWLWTPESKRARLRLRLVSCDPRFAGAFVKDHERSEVNAHFLAQLSAVPAPQSDRARWQVDADSVGHQGLFVALWEALELVHVPRGVILNDPAGPLLFAERAALDHLLQRNIIWADTQADALARLRRLVHENLITFDPADRAEPAQPKRPPHTIDAADVSVALFAKGKDAAPLLFAAVDRLHLASARSVERKRFLFEPPEWHHVVRGADDQLKFIERDQTAELALAVRERLLAPLRRGASGLSALFVTGPPGAGKSTIVRRVAAQLVEAGEVVVADAGHNLANTVPGGVERYVRQLTQLAQQGRPVLLILDDPLSAESEWTRLLRHLKQPGLQVAAVCATPDFLYHSYEHELRGIQAHAFPIMPPSAKEKQDLVRLYGNALTSSEHLPDDLLVMVATASEGKPFPEIMRRLWDTLNGGQGFGAEVAFERLPWPVRAFWFVCALHRTYTPCPLPILRAALALSGGTGGLDASTSLARLKTLGGWNIFRLFQAAGRAGAAEELVSTAHQKVASVAWDERPGSWFDNEVMRVLASATLQAPRSMSYVAAAAGQLAKARFNSDSQLAQELIGQWIGMAARGQSLETRNLCVLSGKLATTGGRDLVRPMLPVLLERAVGSDGWLAALQLHFLSADEVRLRSFPNGMRLSGLIAEADFSLAPRRAIAFASALREKEQTDAMVSRLCASVDGDLDWPIPPHLLTWLLSNASSARLAGRTGQFERWLTEHDDDHDVRTQYLAFLLTLPGSEKQREDAAAATERWLARHEGDGTVRAKYLAFLLKLPGAFAELREEAAVSTEGWLARHEDDGYVRTQYLAFIQQLPRRWQFDALRERAATAAASWLGRHQDDTTVRVQYLVFILGLPKGERFDDLREQVAIDTAAWVARHDDNSSVRTHYLAFVQHLPKGPRFDRLRELEATEAAKWLARHANDHHFRTKYLAFIQQLPEEARFHRLREQAAIDTARWLADHEDDTTVRTQNLAFIRELPQEKRFDELREQAATDTASWLVDQGDDSCVRTQYLAFVQQLPREARFDRLREQAASDTARWLADHQDDTSVRTGYVSFLLAVRQAELAELEAASIPHHQRLIASRPTDLGFRLVFGNQLLRLGRFEEAKGEFEQVLAGKPRHQLARRGLAIALQKLGEPERAEGAFREALFSAQANGGMTAMFRTSLGSFYLDQKRWHEAIKEFAEAKRENPEYFGNHEGIAEALTALGMLAGAKEALQRALDDPRLRSPARERVEEMLANTLQQIDKSTDV